MLVANGLQETAIFAEYGKIERFAAQMPNADGAYLLVSLEIVRIVRICEPGLSKSLQPLCLNQELGGFHLSELSPRRRWHNG